MRNEVSEAVWLNEQVEISYTALVEQSGLSGAELQDLLSCGVLLPRDARGADPARWTFSAQCLVAAQTASRLRDDFDLNAGGVALALSLLERLRVLEQDLVALRARLPGSADSA